MTNKTRQAIRDVLANINEPEEMLLGVLAKICAIVDKEREGECVLGEGDFWDLMDCKDWNFPSRFEDATGRLIFVPDQEPK